MPKKKRKQPPTRGPLPIDDRNAELQSFSLSAIERVLSREVFILRREEQSDRGVDLTIELKERVGSLGYATGERANAQVKSCEKIKGSEGSGSSRCQKLSSGVISYPVPTYNLNQLLNHHCPLYILYVRARRILYFAWAWEEVRRIEEEGTDWRNQETVTIHFSERLTKNTLKQLRTRIEAESRVHRGINDVVSKSSSKSSLTIHVNLPDHTISDPAEVKRLLLEGGTHFVEQGYGAQVLDLIERLDSEDKKLPRMHLIRAFAEYSRARYQQASGNISEALLKSAEIPERDLLFLELLRNACDFHTGVISLLEYTEKQRQLAEKGEGEFALARKIDYLRNRCLGERDPEAKEQLLTEFRAEVEKALALEKSSKEFRIMARTALIYVDGTALARSLLESLRHLILPVIAGRKPKVAEVITRNKALIADWFTRANQLMKDALELRNAPLGANAIEDVAYIVFLMRVHPHVGGDGNSPEDGLFMKNQTIKSQVMPNVKAGIDLYERCDNIQGVLRMKLLLANCAELIGEKEHAATLAKEVLKPASEFRFTDLVQQAEGHIRGKPFYRAIESGLLESGPEDIDIRGAKEDDAAVRRNAKRALEALGLPKGRLANVERDFFSFRDISKERVIHCRHIEILQENAGIRSPEDDYRRDPDRICSCRLHGVRSRVPSKDWPVLIKVFKDNYCNSCGDRDPKIKATKNE